MNLESISKSTKHPHLVLRAGNYSADTRIKPPEHLVALLAAGQAPKPKSVTAKFHVTYTGFTAEAKKAFQAAVHVWSVTLKTNVTIRVDAHWTPLGPGVLGSAGPTTSLRDFTNAPKPQTWFAAALANKIAGKDLAPNDSHIDANFSSEFDNWYFGTDGATPNDRYDLMSVILHELGHGLGFIGAMDMTNGGRGTWGGLPFIFDHFTENSTHKKLLSFPNNSLALAGQLKSNHVFFNGPKANPANGGNPAKLYTPMTWEDGSSYSHLDESTFAAGNTNSLMSPQLGMGEAIHHPGPLGLAILEDQGW
jgi:hypothetical protein